MADDERGKELQKYHNEGEKDASAGEHETPHGFLATGTADLFAAFGLGKGRENLEEDNAAYGTGHANTTQQKEESSSGGGCYLTTACTLSRGLPDDCLELMTLRGFRDAILMRTPSGRREVADYYQTAPKIVAAVNAERDASSIWNKVYGDVKTAVDFVRRGRYHEAFNHYKKMTLRLKEAHL